MSTDTEAQGLLEPALSMGDADAANHYLQVCHEWYNQQHAAAFKAFLREQHIPRISKLLQSKEDRARLDAVRALAFMASSARLHRHMFDCGILESMVHILATSTAAATCEAALVVMNHLVQQNRETQRNRYNRISEFCKHQQSLFIVFRYAHVQDSCRSLLANVFSVLAQLCNQRQGVQERCIRAGIMERAYNLKTSNRERTVRTNADIFLKSMQLEHYSVEKYNEMHAVISINMGFPSRALCLAIWRLVITERQRDAQKVNTLLTVVMKIEEEDTTLNDEFEDIQDYEQNQPEPKPQIAAKPLKQNKVQSQPSHDPPSSAPHPHSHPHSHSHPHPHSHPNSHPHAHSQPHPHSQRAAHVVSSNMANSIHSGNGMNGVNHSQSPPSIAHSNHNHHQHHPHIANNGHSSPSHSPHPSHPHPAHHSHSNGYHPIRSQQHHGSSDRMAVASPFACNQSPPSLASVHSAHSAQSNANHIAHGHARPPWSNNIKSAPYASPQNNGHRPMAKPEHNRSHSDSHEYDEKEFDSPHHGGLRRVNSGMSFPESEQDAVQSVQQMPAYPNHFQISRHQSWLEKDLHIAILQTNPILQGEGSSLALNAERKRLEEIFCRTSRGLKFFFGVLTKDSLIRCIQRGAQILHISGHGPHAKALEVEDKFGNAIRLDAAKIKAAMEKGSASKKHGGLQLVFVSTCHSEWVAQSFCDAGVPHAVAVHSEVLILDKMATKFASAFYEALIAQDTSVEDAFTNSKAELLLEATDDCCCSHQGHKPECLCPICKKPRCCKKHHGPSSKCRNKIEIECCQPDVPHKHSDKFLLLPKGGNHRSHILSNLANVPSERIDCRPPTNIAAAKRRILDRSSHISKLVNWLHPETPQRSAMDAVWIYGRPKVGLTSLSLEVGRFFTRAWYQPLFPGGVFRVDLAKCYDPKALFLYIAQAMELPVLSGTYSYWDSAQKRYMLYDHEVQNDLLKALSADSITPPIETMNKDNGDTNYILLRQHMDNKGMVRNVVPPVIYERFLLQQKSLPMEFGIDPQNPEKVVMKRIRFNEPDEREILKSIRSYGLSDESNGGKKASESNGEKLFIFDHINLPVGTGKVMQFLQKIKSLNESVKCKLLLVCSNLIEPEVSRLQHQHSFIPKSKFQRIMPIHRKAAVKLLLESARGLFPNTDFHGLKTPSTEDAFAEFALFEWLSKSPALIQHTAMVLDRNVPLCVIIKQLDAEPNQWAKALTLWQPHCRWTPDERRDAELALTTLLTNIAQVRDIWKDQQQPRGGGGSQMQNGRFHPHFGHQHHHSQQQQQREKPQSIPPQKQQQHRANGGVSGNNGDNDDNDAVH